MYLQVLFQHVHLWNHGLPFCHRSETLNLDNHDIRDTSSELKKKTSKHDQIKSHAVFMSCQYITFIYGGWDGDDMHMCGSLEKPSTWWNWDIFSYIWFWKLQGFFFSPKLRGVFILFIFFTFSTRCKRYNIAFLHPKVKSENIAFKISILTPLKDIVTFHLTCNKWINPTMKTISVFICLIPDFIHSIQVISVAEFGKLACYPM